MPLHHLAVPPTDVCGSGLGLALNAPGPEPLARLTLDHPDGTTLTLGVLGASHVITVERPDPAFSEEISCTARSHGGALPATAQAAGYQLHSHTEYYDEAAFRAIAATLREQCARQNNWLGGSFPGDDAALTALSAEPDDAGWCWRTWHLYPAGAGGEVVHTISRWRP